MHLRHSTLLGRPQWDRHDFGALDTDLEDEREDDNDDFITG